MTSVAIDIKQLRNASRKLLREWGILKLSSKQLTPTHFHALIEIASAKHTAKSLSESLILDISTVSRVLQNLSKDDLIRYEEADDKRKKYIYLTDKGQREIRWIDKFSDKLIFDAFAFTTPIEQAKILEGIALYSQALEKSRLLVESIEIRTLRKDKLLRQRIAEMVAAIQKRELDTDDSDINQSILDAEAHYYYKNKCNFWYAIDRENKIVGCIGLKPMENDAAELKKCFVKQAYRGRGLAQKLMLKLLKQAEKHHIQHIYLGCVTEAQAAQQFYKKLGFEQINKKHLPKSFSVTPNDSIFLKGDTKQLLKNLKDML